MTRYCDGLAVPYTVNGAAVAGVAPKHATRRSAMVRVSMREIFMRVLISAVVNEASGSDAKDVA